MHVALPKQAIKSGLESRQQALRAYCPNIYTSSKGDESSSSSSPSKSSKEFVAAAAKSKAGKEFLVMIFIKFLTVGAPFYR